MAIVDRIVEFEQGTLDEDATVSLFQELVNTGIVWSLQGVYGRLAIALINAGHIIPRAKATA